MLYSERKRLKEIALQENDGQNLWTIKLSSQFRNKLQRIIRRYGYVANDYDTDFGLEKILKLASHIYASSRGEDDRGLISYLTTCPDENVPDIIESIAESVKIYSEEGVKKPNAVAKFQADVNDLLESYRVSYSLEDCEIIEFSSREIHSEIVQPTLRLLTKAGWEEVEKAYQDSLKEVASGNVGDAITDATTALQEGLRKSGCKGADFASLMKSAKNGILKGYDSKYIEAIDKLISWVSATRSNRGDSHKVSDADKEDAWFVIHIVGILILRLSKMDVEKQT
jgi:hypothetical protein